jgi:divalent metal cation (Fe/Co/Zn/Cd) transporter
MKNKTFVTWLTLLGGPIGLHRFYLFGLKDYTGWTFTWITLIGLYGVQRVQEFGLDDVLSWWLLPVFGFAIAACCLNAILYGLMSTQAWNEKFNPKLDAEHPSGHTNWLTIGAIVIALMVGATVLLSSFAYSFQRYFEYQIEEAHKMAL